MAAEPSNVDAISSELSFSGDAYSNDASLTSTPPTSADSLSLASDQTSSPKPCSIAGRPAEESHDALDKEDAGQGRGSVHRERLGQDLPQHKEGSGGESENSQQKEQRVETHEQHVHSPDPRAAPETKPEPNASQPEPQLDTLQKTPVAPAKVVAAEELAVHSTGRSRRARANPVYNLSKLSGTDIHGRRRAKGDVVRERRRRTTGDLGRADGDATVTGAGKLLREGIDALDLDWSIPSPSTPRGASSAGPKKATPAREALQRRTTRLSGLPVESLATKVSALGKRSRKTFENGMSRISRELKRLQDTDEFAHIDKRPVIHTVWSNGKFIDPRELERQPTATPPQKKAKTTTTEPEREEEGAKAPQRVGDAPATPSQAKPRIKKWLEKGLYAGQEAPKNMLQGLTAQEKKSLAQFPELASGLKRNRSLPMPMFNGLRILMNGRDFKLPYDICNPLPPGQPKPATYRTMTKNRFIGDAGAYWKKTPHFQDFQSKCVCQPEDGCAEQCQNRIMLYECDDTNCNAGRGYCTNRAFQSLQERIKQGGRYRIGVEVFKTADRGYGVRSNRYFEPNHIIMEYTGEIITEEECERRMNEVYRDNECYYLMSFDQNMIIDATTGSIARFVNHSCSPNCRMIKWIVSGQPRMALFAGDRPIATGEELTYDYNFDPFSAKNVQKCLCGSPNCRGVLGPKSRDPKAQKQEAPPSKKSVKDPVSAGKRKLKALLGADEGGMKGVKKRKVLEKPTAGRRTLSATSLKAAKGAATAIRRGLSSISVGARASSASKRATKPPAGRRGHEIIRTTKAAIAASIRRSGHSQTAVAVATATRRSPKKKGGPEGGPARKGPVAASPGKKGKPGAAATTSPSSSKSPKARGEKHSSKTATTIAVVEAAITTQTASPRKRTPSRKLLEATASTAAAAAATSATASPAAKKKASPRKVLGTTPKKPTKALQKAKQGAAGKPRKSLAMRRTTTIRLVGAAD